MLYNDLDHSVEIWNICIGCIFVKEFIYYQQLDYVDVRMLVRASMEIKSNANCTQKMKREKLDL